METRSFGVCEATILQTVEMRGESGDVGEDGGDVEGDRPEETGSEEAVHEPETREICHGELQAYLVARLQEQVARDGHDEEPKSEGVEDPLRLVDELQGSRGQRMELHTMLKKSLELHNCVSAFDLIRLLDQELTYLARGMKDMAMDHFRERIVCKRK